METVASKDLRNKDNHTNCECGNKTIYAYSWNDSSGQCTSCPQCMVAYQANQIKAMKELVYKLSPKSEEETASEINKKYAELLGCNVEDFEDDEEMDFSKID